MITAASARRSGTREEVEPRGDRTAWLALTGCLLGLFMQMLDTTIVNIALPDLTVDLGASTSEQVFVLSVYTLAFACTLLTAATLGGRFGRRRTFVVAMIAFVATSLLCGVAQNPVELIAFRGVQGMSAALMSAQTLALIAALFPKSRHGMVFGIYGAVAGLAAMSGPIIGGLLVTADVLGWGWRTIFFVNAPLGVVACVLAWSRLPQLRDPHRVRFDVAGVALSTGGLFLLLYPLAVGREQDWPPRLWAMMAAGGALLAAFVLVARAITARGGTPLLRLDLFASRSFSVGLVLSLLFFSVFAGFFFTVSITAQFGLGYSPLRTGLLALPFAVGAAVGSVVSPLLVSRSGSAITLCVGVLTLSAGLAWLGVALDPQAGALSVPAVLAPLVIGGVGTGFFVAPLQTAILSDTSPENVGSASGCVPTVQQIGASIGLAIVTIFFFGQVAAHAPAAVSTTRTELTSALQDSSVDPMFRGVVVNRFASCAQGQLTSAHPERPAPGCTASSGQSGIAARLAAQSSDEVRTAGRAVAARSFVGAFAVTLWALAGVGVVIGALSLLLRRR